MRATPAEEMRWCAAGCGAEVSVDKLRDGACPKCAGRVVDLGWRYRNSRGSFEYVSRFEALPPEVRKVSA
jgi:hypothetical protein